MHRTGRNRPLEFAPLYRESFILAGIKSGKFQTTEIGLEKRCSCCREYWPADTTFFALRMIDSTRCAEHVLRKRRRRGDRNIRLTITLWSTGSLGAELTLLAILTVALFYRRPVRSDRVSQPRIGGRVNQWVTARHRGWRRRHVDTAGQ